jgi:hypothetical protein
MRQRPAYGAVGVLLKSRESRQPVQDKTPLRRRRSDWRLGRSSRRTYPLPRLAPLRPHATRVPTAQRSADARAHAAAAARRPRQARRQRSVSQARAADRSSLLAGADPVNVGPALGAQGVPVRERSPVVRRVRNCNTRSNGVARPEQGAEVRLERDPERGDDEMVPASMATPTSSTADVAAPRLLGAQAPGAAALSSLTAASLTQRFHWTGTCLRSCRSPRQ